MRSSEAFQAAFLDILVDRLAVQLHLQPIAALRETTVAGYEVLSRFPACFGLPPDICFAHARTLGLGDELEDKIFGQTLHLRAALPPNTFMSLNVSPGYLLSDKMERRLQGMGSLGGLVFEITEETAIQNYADVRRRLRALRSQGGMVAVDDAGSGYASLSHILELKPEFIKVDRRLTQDCHLDRAKSTLIEMLGAAANRMDAWVVAEGVECSGELEELALLGVPLAQGYFLGRPESAMQGLSSAARRVLGRTSGAAKPETALAGLVSPAAGYLDPVAAAKSLHSAVDGGFAVVADARNRPVQVLLKEPGTALQTSETFMRVQLETDPKEALQRAMLRPKAIRFDPLVVIDPEGVLVGSLQVERLLHAVLGSSFTAARRGL